MAPTEKKRRGQWSEIQLKKAIKAVKRGQMSQRNAAEAYGIPRRTLRNHLKSGKTKKVTGRPPVLNKTQEQDLSKRIIRLGHVGMPLTPKLTRKQAYEFCRVNELKNNFSDKSKTAGKKWLKGFMASNPEISVRKAQVMNRGRAQKLNKHIVQKHFEAVKNIYDELDISTHPERLYNMDEKGCRLNLHHQQKVLAEKGSKRVHMIAEEHAENVTIAMCVNATGNTVPPMILFKGKRLKPEFSENLPAGSLVKMAPKGSMTTELFVDFIKHLAQHKSPGKCLLIFDGASSHLDARIVDEADNHEIVLYCLPSNTTHELQPLDKSVNKSYESHWDEEVLLYAYQYPDRKITKQRFSKIFDKVWFKCMTQENIINGFKATGLYPYDPHAIPEVAYAPSALTQLSATQLQNHSTVKQAPDIGDVMVSPRHDNSSDTNVTCFEENPRDLSFSPSILAQIDADELSENDLAELNIMDILQFPTSSSTRKLVDYSSSSECTTENNSEHQDQHRRQPFLNIPHDRNSEFRSPIPTTSGINVHPRRLVNSSSSNESDQEDYDQNMLHFTYSQYPARKINIYTSSSESEEENINPQTREKTYSGHDEQEKFGDSDDNIPLSKIKETVETLGVKTPFHKQIPTPNFATVKSKPRRKALNYIGQKITKDLFDVKDKTKPNSTKHKKADKPKKESMHVKGQPKQKTKKQKKQKKVNPKDIQNAEIEVWFCKACNMDSVADMRQCIKCSKWYHEECIGLTKEDVEIFICPDCD